MASVGLRALETAQGERGEFDQFGVSTRSTGYARGWVRRCATALRVSTRTRVFVGRSSAPVGGRRGSHDHHGGGLQAWVVALIATHLPASLNLTLAGHVTAPPTCLLSSAERRIRGHLLRPCAGRGPEMTGTSGAAFRVSLSLDWSFLFAPRGLPATLYPSILCIFCFVPVRCRRLLEGPSD